MQVLYFEKVYSQEPMLSPFRAFTTASAALLGIATTAIMITPPPAAKAAQIFGFTCYSAGSKYVIAVGNIPAPTSNVAMNTVSIPSLAGSRAFPFAVITSKIGNYPIARRCSAIATRLTNLALATNTASPLGILALSKFLVAGTVANQPVIAVDSLTLGDVLATLPAGTDPQQALAVINTRLRVISAGKAIAEAIRAGEVVEFEVIPIN